MSGGVQNSPALMVLVDFHSNTCIAVSGVIWYSLNILIYQDFLRPTM